jgi:hypothetical protein
VAEVKIIVKLEGEEIKTTVGTMLGVLRYDPVWSFIFFPWWICKIIAGIFRAWRRKK